MAARSRKLIGGVSAAAIVIATPLIMKWEGRRNDPYQDIVKIWTVCDGQTNVPMRHYSDDECDAMLADTLASDYAGPIARCVPGLKDRPYVFAASLSLSYNIGDAAFCRSTIARRFNAGDWRGGCQGFSAWVYAGGRKVQGLANRRRDEAALCMLGAS